MIRSAFVHVWNRRVGAVLWDESSNLASFEFDTAYLKNGADLAPLTMPLEGARGHVFSFPELASSKTFRGLPGLLAEALPGSYGNRLITAWFSSRGRDAQSLNPVELLCFIGKRGMGALEFQPAETSGLSKSSRINLNKLIPAAEELLNARSGFPLPNGESPNTLRDLVKTGTSAGGNRANMLVAFNADTGELLSGQTEASEGFGYWLLKIDELGEQGSENAPGSGRVEMAYSQMAQKAGIHVKECRLLEENGRAHLLTRRFDRTALGKKIHIQSLCAIRHLDFTLPAHSYETAFETLRLLGLTYPEAEQLFRRMVFNVLARNANDHTKSIVFLLEEGGKWKLAPAFGLHYACRPDSHQIHTQSLSIRGKRENIQRQDFLELAKSVNVKKAAAIVDEVREAILLWPEFAARAGVPEETTQSIRKELLPGFQ